MNEASRAWSWIGAAALTGVLALYGRVSALDVPAACAASLFGIAIVGAAFLLTCAAEVAEIDISQGLAIAFLALIAVLPEYAVDLYFAWKSAAHPGYTAYATANMTGANRMLIGVAWPLIVSLQWWRWRRRSLVLTQAGSVELVFLTVATAYSFVIPWRQRLDWVDAAVLVSVFVAYLVRTARHEAEVPEIVGPAAVIAALRPARRRSVVVGLFVFSGAVIVASAEPFAEALVHLGQGHGIDEFLLVQWVAPLASEAPEIVVACVLALRGKAQVGLGAMISSKLNQWTLLVGTLPLVYSVACGRLTPLQLDHRQVQEIFLTGAQSLFGIAVLCDLRLSLAEAGLLSALFFAQLLLPYALARYGFALAYLAMGCALLVRKRRSFRRMIVAGSGLR